MVEPIVRIEPPKKEDTMSFNPMANLMNMDNDKLATDIKYTEEPSTGKKRGRPAKVIKATTEDDLARDAKTPMNSNMPYYSTYSIPTHILTQTAMQIEDLAQHIKHDLDLVRSAKTMRNKYNYVTELSSTLGALYSNKISIAREMANTLTNSHRLELSKHKELQSAANEENDEKRIMDYFNAFMNAPMGNMPVAARQMSPQMVNTPEMGVPIMNTPEGDISIADDSGFNNYMTNMTPEQNQMLQSANPFVETVVVYDQSTQGKWFEVIDTRTGQQVPNMPLPADFVLGGCVVDVRNGTARNASLNKTYKLKLVGTRMADEF